jgi:hypothetical protein
LTMSSMNNLLDWSNLRILGSDQKKSFEELCYQIVCERFGQKGNIISIDDSGGGDGVEFYLELPNGDIWGWQCKFFDRLADGGRKEQIKSSLQKSYEIHQSKLKKWFLCTKTSLTREERNWFENSLPASIHKNKSVLPKNHSIKLESWGDSEILRYLQKYPSIWRFFFNTKILTKDWFSSRAHLVLHSQEAKQKYLVELHVKEGADFEINMTLGGKNLAEDIQNRMDVLNVAEFQREFEEAVIGVLEQSPIKNCKGIQLRAKKFAKRDKELISNGIAFLGNMIRLLQADRFSIRKYSAIVLRAKKHQKLLLSRYSLWSRLKEDVTDAAISWEKEKAEKDEKKKRSIKSSRETLLGPFFVLRNYDVFFGIFSYLFSICQTSLHVSGEASMGKTHLALSIFEDRIKEGLPAIFLFGKEFKTDAPFYEQLRQILDIPIDWSFEEWLGALDVSAKVYGGKATIIIDGLNESVHWRKIWNSSLERIILQIAHNYPNIVFITTYRSAYEPMLFPDGFFRWESGNRNVSVHGFRENTSEAVSKYFKHYNITLEGYSRKNHLAQFQQPLYLKIFCESKRNQVVTFLDDDLFSVFDIYLAQCNKNINECRGKLQQYNKGFLSKVLSIIGKYLWENSTRTVPISLLTASGLTEEELVCLEGEGLLIYRDWKDEECFVVTYDLLAGYIIAQYLVSLLENKDDLIRFVESEKFQNNLISNQSRVGLFQDVLRCFVAVATKKFGFFSLQIKELWWITLEIIFELNRELISKESKTVSAFVTSAFNESSNRKQVLALATNTELITNHPLNFEFFFQHLFDLSVADRDLSWTEFLRNSEIYLGGLSHQLEWLESVCKKQPSNLDSRIHLQAKKAFWCLTTTDRDIRDKATRALYRYGRKHLQEFVEFVIRSLDCNDAYVTDRILSIYYGIILISQNPKNNLPAFKKDLYRIAMKLFGAFFSASANFSTSITMRDHARRIIEIAILHNPSLLTKEEMEKLAPPYLLGKTLDWPESDYEGKERGGPIQMDFSNYTLGYIIKDGHSYNDPPEKKKARRQLYWRIFDLGWSNDKFLQLDRGIAESRYHDRGERAPIERYGKKYSWIAYYELAGYLQDRGDFKLEDSDFRFNHSDFDPTFPEPEQKHSLILDNFLGSENDSDQDWMKDTTPPSCQKYLRPQTLLGLNSGAVCLDGYFSQEDKTNDRKIFAFIRSFLVHESRYDELVKHLKSQDLGGRWLPEKVESHDAYSGEIYVFPEATYPNWREMEFLLEKKLVKVKKGDPGYFPDTAVEFTEKGLRIKNHYPKTKEIEKAIFDTFSVLQPVSEFSFSGYYTTDKTPSCTVVAPEIAREIGLYYKPQTFELFDINGFQKTEIFGHHESYNSSQHFVFIDRKTLEEYLERENLRIVWAVWGERNLYREGGGHPNEQNWHVFQDIYEMNQLLIS